MNDFAFVQKLQEYNSTDQQIAQTASKAFEKHFWYLTPELVPLTLFSSADPAVKESMAEKLLKIETEVS